jgi:hypothetical protein
MGSALVRLLDGARHATIWKSFLRYIPGSSIMLPAWAVVAAAVLGATPRLLAASLPLRIALGLLLVFVGVYVVTPLDLSWLLSTSAGRLFLQIWPAFLLGLFSACASDPPAKGSLE